MNELFVYFVFVVNGLFGSTDIGISVSYVIVIVAGVLALVLVVLIVVALTQNNYKRFMRTAKVDHQRPGSLDTGLYNTLDNPVCPPSVATTSINGITIVGQLQEPLAPEPYLYSTVEKPDRQMSIKPTGQEETAIAAPVISHVSVDLDQLPEPPPEAYLYSEVQKSGRQMSIKQSGDQGQGQGQETVGQTEGAPTSTIGSLIGTGGEEGGYFIMSGGNGDKQNSGDSNNFDIPEGHTSTIIPSPDYDHVDAEMSDDGTAVKERYLQCTEASTSTSGYEYMELTQRL